jgi:hypothetical protein
MHSFFPSSLAEWVQIISGIATVIVIFFLYNQMKSTDRSNRLAYGPLLIVRKTLVGGPLGFTLQMVNIGNGGAKNIVYSITDEQNQNLAKDAKIPALKAGEEIGTGILWKPARKVKVTGSYEDAIGEKYSLDLESEF